MNKSFPSFSITIPTIGRESLHETLESLVPAGIGLRDKVMVIADGRRPLAESICEIFKRDFSLSYLEMPTQKCWGHAQRNYGMKLASPDQSHLMSIDDDDAYIPESLSTVRKTAKQHPDRILIFKMRSCTPTLPWKELWNTKDPVCGNVGTPMMVVPHKKEYLGAWGNRYEGDWDFLNSTLDKWPGGERSIVWVDHVIAEIG